MHQRVNKYFRIRMSWLFGYKGQPVPEFQGQPGNLVPFNVVVGMHTFLYTITFLMLFGMGPFLSFVL